MKTFLYIIFVFNVFSFLLFGYDKLKSIKNGYRIPEKTLLISSLFLNATGSVLSMKIFKHKTQKPLFVLTLPILMAFQWLIIIFIANLF